MRLMVSGGGTGGHIYPALALIERLKQVEPDTEVLYVGAKRGLETKIVPQAGYRLETMEVQGFRRSLSLENVKTVYLFLKAVAQAKKLIKDFRPDVVLGTGGYVSGAVLYAATNKFLARYVNEVAIAFEAARSQFPKSSVTMTGNPRAQQVAQRTNSAYSWTEDGLKDGVPTIMIFGGSQGAPRINKAVVEALPSFNEQPYQVIFATGRKRYDDVMGALAGQPIGDNVKVVPYIEDMPDKLPHVDALVSRAGATTIAEVTALGIPTILIPSPYVTANHQVKNAEALVKKGAALMILEDQLDGRSLITQANHLMNDAAVRQKMAANSKAVGHPDASDQLIAVLKKAIADHQK